MDGTALLATGRFSSLRPGSGLPPGWRPLTFPKISRHTRYLLVEDQGVTVVKAESDASASALIRQVDIDPARHPVLRWRWKITALLPGSDIHRKDGDDYPARLYITFAYDAGHMSLGRRLRYQAARLIHGDIPAAALNYVWARRAPPGTVTPNAYTDFTRMIVVESGPTHVGQWREEQRNVREDFQRAFGFPPPRITGVAIMTDSDDTGGRATAYYGDIAFLPLTYEKTPH
ncbi:MAG TPA: DUF3047 domain-containing protein [Gammaproteobacteria bacterium]|nr:DUF3047 domain-containing protein [Gammaproteobacteria bacterium]